MVTFFLYLIFWYLLGSVVSALCIKIYIYIDKRFKLEGPPSMETLNGALLLSWIGVYITIMIIIIDLVVHMCGVAKLCKVITALFYKYKYFIYEKIVK